MLYKCKEENAHPFIGMWGVGPVLMNCLQRFSLFFVPILGYKEYLSCYFSNKKRKKGSVFFPRGFALLSHLEQKPTKAKMLWISRRRKKILIAIKQPSKQGNKKISISAMYWAKSSFKGTFGFQRADWVGWGEKRRKEIWRATFYRLFFLDNCLFVVPLPR